MFPLSPILLNMLFSRVHLKRWKKCFLKFLKITTKSTWTCLVEEHEFLPSEFETSDRCPTKIFETSNEKQSSADSGSNPAPKIFYFIEIRILKIVKYLSCNSKFNFINWTWSSNSTTVCKYWSLIEYRNFVNRISTLYFPKICRFRYYLLSAEAGFESSHQGTSQRISSRKNGKNDHKKPLHRRLNVE